MKKSGRNHYSFFQAALLRKASHQRREARRAGPTRCGAASYPNIYLAKSGARPRPKKLVVSPATAPFLPRQTPLMM